MTTKKASDAVLAICNRGCTDVPLDMTARDHAVVCPINNRFLCKFCARRFSQASVVEKHAGSEHNWSVKDGTNCFIRDFRPPAAIPNGSQRCLGLEDKRSRRTR